MLARALAKPSNLMVLDEPTNDLDIETLDLLQELLGDYAGTILLVSHDRDFLDRVATSVIVGDGDGRWVEYAGGYSDMVAQRGYGLAGPLAAPAATPVKADKAPSPERGAAKRKLGFNEKRALETLPGKIEKLRADLDVLERKLADADLPAREPAAFMAATKAYGESARRAGPRRGRVARAGDFAGGAGAAVSLQSSRTRNADCWNFRAIVW